MQVKYKHKASLSSQSLIKRIVLVNYFIYLHFDDFSGTLASGSLEAITMEKYDTQMNINTRAPLLMTKLCLPYILESKGNIVNVSSVTGIRAVNISFCLLFNHN